jgi:hypothetical protein
MAFFPAFPCLPVFPLIRNEHIRHAEIKYYPGGTEEQQRKCADRIAEDLAEILGHFNSHDITAGFAKPPVI